MHNHDRAVSEVLGYILVFSLVISSAAIVSTVGFTQLDSVRDAEQMNNAERAFDLLAANMDDIAQKGAPSRSTEMQLADSQIDVSDPIEVTFRGVNNTDNSHNFSTSFDVWPIVYRGQASNTEIVYAGGAVFRTYPESGTTRNEPNIIAGKERTHISLIQTRSRSLQSRGGGTARIRANHLSTELIALDSNGTYDNLYINITSPRANLWLGILSDSSGFENCMLDTSESIDRVWCKTEKMNRVHIAVVTVNMELSN